MGIWVYYLNGIEVELSILNKGDSMKKKVKVKMTCWAIVEIDEDVIGNQTIEDIHDILDIDDFQVENEIN